MKIFKRILIAFIVIILVSIISFVAIFIYEDQFKKREIYQENSPDGNYTIVLYQVGSPQWSFGSVKAKLVLEDANGKKIDEEDFGLANDGAGVFEGNVKEITWMENQVKIIRKILACILGSVRKQYIKTFIIDALS